MPFCARPASFDDLPPYKLEMPMFPSGAPVPPQTPGLGIGFTGISRSSSSTLSARAVIWWARLRHLNPATVAAGGRVFADPFGGWPHTSALPSIAAG